MEITSKSLRLWRIPNRRPGRRTFRGRASPWAWRTFGPSAPDPCLAGRVRPKTRNPVTRVPPLRTRNWYRPPGWSASGWFCKTRRRTRATRAARAAESSWPRSVQVVLRVWNASPNRKRSSWTAVTSSGTPVLWSNRNGSTSGQRSSPSGHRWSRTRNSRSATASRSVWRWTACSSSLQWPGVNERGLENYFIINDFAEMIWFSLGYIVRRI